MGVGGVNSKPAIFLGVGPQGGLGDFQDDVNQLELLVSCQVCAGKRRVEEFISADGIRKEPDPVRVQPGISISRSQQELFSRALLIALAHSAGEGWSLPPASTAREVSV